MGLLLGVSQLMLDQVGLPRGLEGAVGHVAVHQLPGVVALKQIKVCKKRGLFIFWSKDRVDFPVGGVLWVNLLGGNEM